MPKIVPCIEETWKAPTFERKLGVYGLFKLVRFAHGKIGNCINYKKLLKKKSTKLSREKNFLLVTKKKTYFPDFSG